MYLLGEGHVKLVAACGKWYRLKKPKEGTSPKPTPATARLIAAVSAADGGATGSEATTPPASPASAKAAAVASAAAKDLEPPAKTSKCSGWLEFNDAAAVWTKRWFVLRDGGLEIYSTQEDAAKGIRGPEYTQVPVQICSLPKKDTMPRAAKKAGRTHAFVIRLANLKKVLGAPLPKQLVLDPGNSATRLVWLGGLREVLSAGNSDKVVSRTLASTQATRDCLDL